MSSSRTPSTIRRYLRALALIALALGFWLAADFAFVSVGVESDLARPADVIIVLGCPSYENNVLSDHFSACVQVRAHHAADLYKRGLAPAIIPSGGLTGPAPSEAEAMAEVMEADGVPRSALFVEDQARDTIQNIQYSRAIMQAHNWRNAILVTEPHHIRRGALIAVDGGLQVFPSPANDSPSWHTPDARLQNLLRDTQNLMTYQIKRQLGLRV